MNEHPAREDSCAFLVDSKDEGAQAYSDYLLGKTKKCANFEEARESGNGLCADCTGYRGFATWYPKRVTSLFLGTRVSQGSVEGIHDEYVSIDEKISLLSSLVEKITPLTMMAIMSSNEARTYRDDLNEVENVPALEENVRRLTEQMKEGALSSVKEIDDKIHAIDEDIASLNQQKSNSLPKKENILLRFVVFKMRLFLKSKWQSRLENKPYLLLILKLLRKHTCPGMIN